MPILDQEIDLFPADLLETIPVPTTAGKEPGLEAGSSNLAKWWAMYTLARHEKQLMRKLIGLQVPFYGPVVSRRHRSPGGRLRTCYEPLLANYVFIYGDESQRYAALTTNCVSHWLPVADEPRLTKDLRQLRQLIALGEPLTPEARLERGDWVRVRTGIFAGFEGIVLRREGVRRLLVSVAFAQQGASVLLDDCQMDLLYRAEEAQVC